MSDDARKVRRKLSALTKSLDDLETILASLLSQSLPDLVIDLDTIQQAKLQVVIPYLVYDLVFVYLKTRGLDPKTHPVIAELDRVRQYFDKIKDAEDPAKRQLAIDKVAASRFIKHAIAQVKDTRPITVSSPTTHTHPDDNGGSGSGAATARHHVPVPVKVTEKMLEREKYHEALREETQVSGDDDDDDDGDGDLEVFDGEDDSEPSDEADRTPPEEAGASSYSPLQASLSELDVAGEQKGKGKAKAVAPMHDVPPPSETAAGKRRRPPVDPFAGYVDGQDTAAPADATNASRPDSKVRRIHKEDVGAEASSGAHTPSGGDHQNQAKKSKKRSKKKIAS